MTFRGGNKTRNASKDPAGSEQRTNVSKLAGFAGVPLAVALTGLLAAAVARSGDAVQAATQTGTTAPTKALANLLFQDFVYPFELTSFLILVAILGAIVLAAPRSET